MDHRTLFLLCIGAVCAFVWVAWRLSRSAVALRLFALGAFVYVGFYAVVFAAAVFLVIAEAAHGR